MAWRTPLLALLGVVALPAVAAGAAPLDVAPWSVAPFVLLLLAIAVLPLAARPWWHRDRNKALVVALFAAPTAGYLLDLQLTTGQPALAALARELTAYAAFIVLLGSLYTVSGGVVIRGDLRPTPWTNAALLALGCVLANLIGTTGASVLLIRPVLRINRARRHTGHLPVFFIFLVSNLGGLLTPLGDPPLFLGFLNGVPFVWTLSLWPQWLTANGAVLAVFLAWDTLAWHREPEKSPAGDGGAWEPLRLEGLLNLVFLAGVLAGILLQAALPPPWGEAAGATVMAAMAALSLLATPRRLRAANGFTWGPILEVAILFAGIFLTMVPALALLERHGKALGLARPWQFFWLTGGLSAFLDNAPTYLTFATLAAGSQDFLPLVRDQVPGLDGPAVLRAISCGAVLLGAGTYIGNGPNFMVKAIAEEAGYRTPSFFGYLAYSAGLLLPLFVLLTVLFFR